jgi:hypothetical protein
MNQTDIDVEDWIEITCKVERWLDEEATGYYRWVKPEEQGIYHCWGVSNLTVQRRHLCEKIMQIRQDKISIGKLQYFRELYNEYAASPYYYNVARKPDVKPITEKQRAGYARRVERKKLELAERRAKRNEEIDKLVKWINEYKL